MYATELQVYFLKWSHLEDDGAIKEIANPEDYNGIINVVTSSYAFTQVTDDHTEYVYLGRVSPGVTEFRISDDTINHNVNAALAISLEKNSSVGTATSHKGVKVLSFLPSISFVALQSVHTKFIDSNTSDIFGKFTIGAEVIPPAPTAEWTDYEAIGEGLPSDAIEDDFIGGSVCLNSPCNRAL